MKIRFTIDISRSRGKQAARTSTQNRSIPDEWWVEACDVMRKINQAALDGDIARADMIGQWLGGMVRAAAYFTGENHETILSRVRQKVGYSGTRENQRPKPDISGGGRFDELAARRAAAGS